MTDRPVVVVTGGGGGIGAAVAEELGRGGWYVVTVDPLVSLDGSEQLPEPEETTAGRIVAAGGAARASDVSVTDGTAVRGLFEELVAELGHLDAVINVAGISRPTSFTRGSEEDWLGVLRVHLDGYRNVLEAALPLMAAAGHGRILGVTSGSGWRQADTGAYGCAKRAVASLTWQLGRQAPPGVIVNAMSPIAMTRMVTAALGSAKSARTSSSAPRPASTGGLSLGSMPTPEEIGPFGAYLVSDAFASWCSGRVLFAGGSEVAVVHPPRLLEVIGVDDSSSLPTSIDAAAAVVLAPAEAKQASTGGSNPRLGAAVAAGEHPGLAVSSCAIVSDRPALADAVSAALTSRGVVTTHVDLGGVEAGFDGVAAALVAAGPTDAVVVALAGGPVATGTPDGWERTLAEHAGIVDQLHVDASWARAVADRATDRPIRFVTLTDAVTTGGRTRAQSAAQHARAARTATGERVAAFTVSVESGAPEDLTVAGELVAHLVCSPEADALAGAELVTGAGWFGLRSHPHPGGSVSLAGSSLPDWFDEALRGVAGAGSTT